MTKNVGSVDRVVRIGLGGALIVVGVLQGGVWWGAAAFGAVLIVTAAIGFCGLYTVFGINTCKVK